jgi:hypothetical protein
MPRINPADFSETQWIEAFYASELLPGDDYSAAEPFEASAEAVSEAAACCRSKAERARDGELGESDKGEGVDIEDWADDLDEAAAVLEAYLGGE